MVFLKFRYFFFSGISSLLLALPIYAQPLKAAVQAESAILMNADSGVILFEKNSNQVRYPASITKVATALFTLERYANRFNELAVVSSESLKKTSNKDDLEENPHLLTTDSSIMGLKVGERLPLRDLLFGMMLVSGSDAANAIACHCSGSVQKFVSELNEYFRLKGLTVTHFCNPNGLHHPNHVTTAYEMAKLTQIALKNPIFRQIVQTTVFERSPSNKSPGGVMTQFNRLLKKGKFYYPKAIGVKTGYTQAAGYTLVAAAKQSERTLIAVLMGYKDPYQRFTEAKTLFEKAFQQKLERRTLFSKGDDQFSKKCSGAKKPIQAQLQQDLIIEYYPAEEVPLHAQVRWKDIELPIHQGQVVANLEILDSANKLVAKGELYAKEDVGKTFFKSCRDGLRTLFHLKVVLIIFAFAITAFCLRKQFYHFKAKG